MDIQRSDGAPVWICTRIDRPFEEVAEYMAKTVEVANGLEFYLGGRTGILVAESWSATVLGRKNLYDDITHGKLCLSWNVGFANEL